MSAFRRRRSTLNSRLISGHLISRAFCEALESRRMMAVWTGAGTDTNFSDGANWLGGRAPAGGAPVTFPAGAFGTVVTVDTNVTVGAMEFDASYTLSSPAGTSGTGTTIALDGSIDVTAGDTVINTPIALDQMPTITVANPATLTLNGVVSDNMGGNAFGITETGTGTLILASNSGDTYTGATNVNGGTLVDAVDTTLDSAVSVAAGASFIGDSTIESLTGTGGTYSAATGIGAAAAPGVATISDGLDLAGTNNTMDFIVGGPGNSSEFVVNGGEVDLDNAVLNPTLINYAASGGDVITIIANNTGLPIVGTFNGLAEGATTVIGGEEYTISYVGGASGNDVTLTAVFSATTTTTVTLKKTPIYESQTEVLTARVIGSDGFLPSGIVEFYEDEARIGRARLDGGVAQLDTATLPVGADQIYAIYDGAGTHSGSTSATVTVNVRASTIPVIDGSDALETTHGFTVAETVSAYEPSVTIDPDPYLTYTWTAIHLPSGAKEPIFSDNGDNTASAITVRFYKDGGYTLQCQVTNASKQSVYVDVQAVVSQKASSFRIEPHNAQILENSTQQYTTTVLDQFGHPMRTAQTVTYAVESGEESGSISSTGLFFANTVDGAVIIEVEDGLLTGTVGADVV